MKHRHFVFTIGISVCTPSLAFRSNTHAPLHPYQFQTSLPRTRLLNALSNEPSASDDVRILELKNAILRAAKESKGISTTETEKEDMNARIIRLETAAPPLTSQPRDLLERTWRVRYSTAPPPSNGRLGPFVGTALQSLDVTNKIYANELLVGKDESNPWLSACLLADWDELESPDRWKVNFRSITLSLFQTELFTQPFPEGTSRIWITTYLDTDMRIVRAGPTEAEAKRMGNAAKSDVQNYSVFVMTRESESLQRTVVGGIVKAPKIGLLEVLADPVRFMDDDD